MKATTDLLTKLAVALIALPLLGVLLLTSAPVKTQAAAGRAVGDEPQDAIALYTTKCTLCHGEKAEKRFDATKPETELVDAVLKGRKGEKPPFMPAYETKGMTEEQAKVLVTHMKSLKQ